MKLYLIGIAIGVVGFFIAMVFGSASRLGRSDERQTQRGKKPLDFDTDFL
jgi:hypothetical protein